MKKFIVLLCLASCLFGQTAKVDTIWETPSDRPGSYVRSPLARNYDNPVRMIWMDSNLVATKASRIVDRQVLGGYQGYNLKFLRYGYSFDNVVTDSIIWRLNAVDAIGDTLCEHDWVNSEKTTANPGAGCLVYHNGFHCDYDDGAYSRICRKCLRKETWREDWYQHREVPPKSEYEILNEKIK